MNIYYYFAQISNENVGVWKITKMCVCVCVCGGRGGQEIKKKYSES